MFWQTAFKPSADVSGQPRRRTDSWSGFCRLVGFVALSLPRWFLHLCGFLCGAKLEPKPEPNLWHCSWKMSGHIQWETMEICLYVTENTFKAKQEKWKQTDSRTTELKHESCRLRVVKLHDVKTNPPCTESSRLLPSHLSALEDIFLFSFFFLE